MLRPVQPTGISQKTSKKELHGTKIQETRKQSVPSGRISRNNFPHEICQTKWKTEAGQLRALILHSPTSSSTSSTLTSTSTSTSTSLSFSTSFFFKTQEHLQTFDIHFRKCWRFTVASTEHWLDTRMAWNLARLERTNCTFCSRREDWELVWYLLWFVLETGNSYC